MLLVSFAKPSNRLLWALWSCGSLAMAVMAIGFQMSNGDLNYYFRGVRSPGDPDSPLGEYPDVGTWPLHLIAQLTGGNQTAFRIVFMLGCIALSAAFLQALIRHGGRSGSQRGAAMWVVFWICSGPITITRLDILPGLLVALAFGLVATRPRMASALLALATAMKLWPGVLGAALVGHWKDRSTWSRIAAFFTALVALCTLTVLFGGTDRLLSPLSYQGSRGLQIESVLATPFVIAAWFDPRWSFAYTDSKSFEVSGPGVESGIFASTLLTAAVLLFAVGAALVALFRAPQGPQRWTPSLAVCIICGIMVSNKVFSPQYLLWLAPLIAISLQKPSTSRELRAIGYVLPVMALLTFLVYPVFYDWLIIGDPQLIPVSLLTLRNLGLLAVTGLAFAWWRREVEGGRVGTLPESQLSERSRRGRVKNKPRIPTAHTAMTAHHAIRKSAH